MTLRKQDIKSGCVDKMFTALDRHSKTISVNDIVKVLEGSLEVETCPLDEAVYFKECYHLLTLVIYMENTAHRLVL